jgi:hypothetical protein
MPHWGLEPYKVGKAGWTHREHSMVAERVKRGLGILCTNRQRKLCEKAMKCLDHPGAPELLRKCRKLRVDVYTFVRDAGP